MNCVFTSCVLCVLFLAADAWIFKTLLYSKWLTCDHGRSLNISVSEIQVFFYDLQNNVNISCPIDEAAEGITSYYSLNTTWRLIVFVPGYKSHISKKSEELVRQTFKSVSKVYLIIIHHSVYTHSKGGTRKGYERSVFYTYHIGKRLGKFLGELNTMGYPSENIHCIGHSLGSQMLGVAGEEYARLRGGKVWRVTGVDPAGPCFSNSLVEEQLNAAAADYVEVYHCNAGGLGTTAVLVHADFFINKGTSQPQCSSSMLPFKGDMDKAKCSHKKCLRYYMKTVQIPGMYLAWKCDSYKEFSSGVCAGNEVAIAGYHNPGNATGVFYASTEAHGIV